MGSILLKKQGVLTQAQVRTFARLKSHWQLEQPGHAAAQRGVGCELLLQQAVKDKKNMPATDEESSELLSGSKGRASSYVHEDHSGSDIHRTASSAHQAHNRGNIEKFGAGI